MPFQAIQIHVAGSYRAVTQESITVPLYPMDVVLKPAWTNAYCYAVMAVSIVIVSKVLPRLIALIVLQPISVTKKILEGPITLERHCNDAMAHNAIPGPLVLQKLSSDWTSIAFIYQFAALGTTITGDTHPWLLMK